MSCGRFHHLFDLYAAGELDPATAADLESHAADCAACRELLDGARRRIHTLEVTLGSFRASSDLVERTMARVLAEVERTAPPPPAPETLVRRIGRYAALAAAAALFVFAGYGFLFSQPTARYVAGPASRVGAKAASLAPGAALNRGEVVATPPSASESARFRLGGGRVDAWMRPGSIVRIADPRLGTVAHVARGGMLVRRVGDQGAAAAVSTPLGRVAALDGAVSVHVAPLPSTGSEPQAFRGYVTLAAHNGWAQVQVVGREHKVVTLRPGQGLVLRSGRGQVAQPQAAGAIRQRLAGQIRGIKEQMQNLNRQWEHVSAMVREAPREEHPKLFIDGVRLQGMMRKAAIAHGEAARRLKLLECCQDDDRATLRSLQADR